MSRMLSIARDVALGMNYLHSSFPIVVHRDLRPANIMVARDASTAKVGDFGLARTKVFRGMAQMSGGVGAPGYTAPEVLRGEMYSQTADVYGYAAVLLELCASERLLESPEAGMAAMRGLMDDKEWRPEIPPHVTGAWRALIERCWHRDPTERPSFREILEHLSDHAEELGRDEG
jgi:serine/threonine protein kinase